MKDERDALTEEEKKYFLEYDEMLAERDLFFPSNPGIIEMFFKTWTGWWGALAIKESTSY